MLLRAFLLFLGAVFSLSACGKSKRFYCNFYKGRDSVSDRMAVVATKNGASFINVSPFWTLGMKFYKTYDEGEKITTVYKERRPYRYSFFQMDFSEGKGGKALFLYGYGLHLLARDFESTYSLAFTKENFNYINANPELISYLPPAPHPDYLSISFYKRQLDCRPNNLLVYYGNFIRLIFYYLVAGG